MMSRWCSCTWGAAWITPSALLEPARELDNVEVVAVAARERTRAQAFAHEHGIGRVCADYEALVTCPDIDAVYNPLPNSAHAEWTVRALEAGKHVLVEKPFTANAVEAERVAGAASRTGLVVMEAVHSAYHPQSERMREIVRSGELGELEHLECVMLAPDVGQPRDVRYRFDLGGGTTMNNGSYTLHTLYLLGGEPEVVTAKAKLAGPEIDEEMEVQLRFSGGASGYSLTRMFSPEARLDCHVRGSRGRMDVGAFVGPAHGPGLTIETADGKRVEPPAPGSTYAHQLGAFAKATLRGGPNLTPPTQSVAVMRIIDAAYRAAGLTPRGMLPDKGLRER